MAKDVDQLTVSDYWCYSPSRKEWKDSKSIQHGTYRLRRFYAKFGIVSYRWKQLTLENKRNGSC